MKHGRSHIDRKKWMMIAACAIIFLAILGYLFSEQVMEAYEVASMEVFPNAQQEFNYGEEHFDAEHPDQYNISLAEYFFQKAAASDPNIPYLYHELARIAFLKGNFSQALVEINLQISLHGDSEPNAYYVRGLIEGYMGMYEQSAADYAHFIQFEPDNWAAKNDETWVLLKAGDYKEALQVANSGLTNASSNAWLLNSKATALYELGDYQQALLAAQAASTAVSYLTPQGWSVAYPGNDPAIAGEGLDTFKAAVAANIHTIEAAIASSTVQSK